MFAQGVRTWLRRQGAPRSGHAQAPMRQSATSASWLVAALPARRQSDRYWSQRQLLRAVSAFCPGHGSVCAAGQRPAPPGTGCLRPPLGAYSAADPRHCYTRPGPSGVPRTGLGVATGDVGPAGVTGYRVGARDKDGIAAGWRRRSCKDGHHAPPTRANCGR